MASNQKIPLCVAVSCENGDISNFWKDSTKCAGQLDSSRDITLPNILWDFETKYYTCTVRLAHTDNKLSSDIKDLEAVALTFNPDELGSWKFLQDWWSSVEELSPEVRLVVCDSCTEHSKVPKLSVQTWCIENEFELIELNPVDEDEDEFDVGGFTRIVQVLHAHTWPNLVMKGESDTNPYMKKLLEETSAKSDESSGNKETDQNQALGMDIEQLKAAFQDEGENGVESFEQLFSQLHLLREKAEALPPDQRKQYAEQVALSFLNAMGDSDGDSD